MSAASHPAGCLLDTHVVIFSMSQSRVLSATARAATAAGPNFISIVSYWEVMLKSMKGTLDVGDPRIWWHEALEQLNARVLALRPEHIGAIHNLPPIHKDPFDRVLIAQAAAEELTLVSSDGEIARYASTGLRVVS